MCRQVLGDLGVRVGISEPDCSAEVAQERHVGERRGKRQPGHRCKPGDGDRQAASLTRTERSDPGRVDPRVLRGQLQHADGIHVQAAVVVACRVLDPQCHYAREVHVAGGGVEVGRRGRQGRCPPALCARLQDEVCVAGRR